jgi:hypothetical protein
MNNGNPNNRSEKVLVFHNQWLYGRSALNINLRIIKRLKKAFKEFKINGEFSKTKQGYINHFLEQDLKNAIKWASVKDLHEETHFAEPEELIYSIEEKKPKKEQTSFKELLRSQDNNNGFFICIIDSHLKIKYAFLNGFEDDNTIKQRTPKEYLNLFYDDEELKENAFIYKNVIKWFKEFGKFEEIEKETLKGTIAYLNERSI